MNRTASSLFLKAATQPQIFMPAGDTTAEDDAASKKSLLNEDTTACIS